MAVIKEGTVLKFTASPSHIKNGKPGSAHHCVVALAINARYRYAIVGHDTASFTNKSGTTTYLVDLPAKVHKQIDSYDSYETGEAAAKRMKPFDFTVKVAVIKTF